MTTEHTSFKRVKRKIKTSQNPLFEKWLKEWRDEAAKDGSETRHCYSRALKSLQKFPFKLHSGKECEILENFGAKLCRKLDDRLNAYKASHPEDRNVESKKKNGETEGGNYVSLIIEDTKEQNEVSEKNSRKRRSNEDFFLKKKKINTEVASGSVGGHKTSGYVPTHRSGAYAILLTLFEKSQEDNFKGYMTKSEIQTEAQALCDSSFTRPLPGSHFTAWSSMGVLTRKKLVNKEGNPARFTLTNEGVDLAIKLKEDNKTERILSEQPLPLLTSKEGKNKESLSTGIEEEEPECLLEDGETIFMLPGSFEIILLVDNQERDDKFQQGSNMTVQALNARHVSFEMRHLKVGDFLWIARDANGRELVLPYIVERKRMDDLASSIKDGRFHEQKFRLKQSGVENLIYLVEKYGNENQRLGLPLPTLLQAISNTQVTGGFTVRVTGNHDHSMRYLNCLTAQLSQLFKAKSLMSCKKSNLSPLNLSDDLIPLLTFREFNKGSEKNKKPTVRNMLVKHLLQLNGVSVEKAKAIVQAYPTPKALMAELKGHSGEKSIAELTCGGFNRAIGPVTAKQIHSLYTSLDLL